MTLIQRFLAEPSDVLALRLFCLHCQAALSIPFDETQRIPERCTNPSCKKRDWFLQNSIEAEQLDVFVKAMHIIRSNQKNGRYQIQFEFEHPGNTKSD